MPSNGFIDAHCHIDTILEWTHGSVEDLFNTMEPAPEAIIHVACDPKDFEWGKSFLAREQINSVKIYGAFGVHPLAVNEIFKVPKIHNLVNESYSEALENTIKNLKEYLNLPRVVALGEIGLDYHYENFDADLQKKVFLRQLEIGFELKKNFVFHLREAERDAFEILQSIDNKDIKAHIHCYTGTPDFAEKVLSLKGQYYFGFTGAVTFNKTETIRDAAKLVPLNRILLETDAPYLAPVPFRGKTCTPAMIPKIAETIAAIKNIPVGEVFKACRENTEQFIKN